MLRNVMCDVMLCYVKPEMFPVGGALRPGDEAGHWVGRGHAVPGCRPGGGRRGGGGGGQGSLPQFPIRRMGLWEGWPTGGGGSGRASERGCLPIFLNGLGGNLQILISTLVFTLLMMVILSLFVFIIV